MLCLGLDDTFVVLNSWQHTDRKASVSERMGVCLAEVKKTLYFCSEAAIKFKMFVCLKYFE